MSADRAQHLDRLIEDLREIGESPARAAAFVFLSGMFEFEAHELRRARRLAAKHIHPDVVAEEHRAEATAKMTAVNVAVDTAISEMKEQP